MGVSYNVFRTGRLYLQACCRLNLGLDVQHTSEEETLIEIQLSRAQYKGYLRVLQACVAGIEQQYSAPGDSSITFLHIYLTYRRRHWSRVDIERYGDRASALLGERGAASGDAEHIV